MIKARGVHHIAFSTADMKGQLEFFSDVLGLPLVAIFPMHGVPGGIHAFLEGAEECLISFVQLPVMAEIEIEFGKTHAGSGALPSAPGTLQHLALVVDSDDELLAMRDRIRSRGVNVMGPIDHGMCRSIYFAGLEGLTLEIATSDEAVDPKHWIDPEAAAEVGITGEALDRLAKPTGFERPAEPVPQPPYDPAKPHMQYPKEVYEQMLAMTDEQIAEASSFAEPPVP
ncbi:MAG: VOC family protein [Myxococcales bacterium]|nr:VOC family protein [Myxococcales bacterium]